MGASCSFPDEEITVSPRKLYAPVDVAGCAVDQAESPPRCLRPTLLQPNGTVEAYDTPCPPPPAFRAPRHVIGIAPHVQPDEQTPVGKAHPGRETPCRCPRPGGGFTDRSTKRCGEANDVESERCALCLQALASHQVGVCMAGDGRRVCMHYAHLSCLRRVQPRRCPHCRAEYEQCDALPDILEDPQGWSRLVSLSGQDSPTKKEVLAAFKAMLLVPHDEVEELLSRCPAWVRAGSRLSVGQIRSLARSMEPHLPPPPSSEPPDWGPDGVNSHHCSAAQPHAQDGTSIASGHHGGNIPGAVCSCGCIHVHRGDRVRRGPAWNGGDEDGGEGQFGTIVKDEEISDSVSVVWDQSVGHVRRYKWPANPQQHEVQHVGFASVPEDVRAVQEATGLSSGAAAELLRRRQSDLAARLTRGDQRAAVDIAPVPSEEELLEKPQLFRRCRIMPDKASVQRWFEGCPPCPCRRHSCQGGVLWSDQAERHLGREGYCLKIDERDGTALVELTGRCNCRIWYPLQAVQPVFDIDAVEKLRFKIGDFVKCKVGTRWHVGTVNHLWWRPSEGWGNRSTAPYTVRLLDGRSVFAPRDTDNVIKALRKKPVSPTSIGR